MTFVLNKDYGGWSISEFAQEKLGVNTPYPQMTDELTDKLADLIYQFGSEACSGHFANLVVVNISDTCTDFEVNEYDGFETLTYVVDGKLYHA